MTGESLTLHTREVTGQDGDGNDVYGDVPTDAGDDWVVYPRNSSELVQGQDTLIVGITAVARRLVAIKGVDTVTVETGPYAADYTVDGLPGFYSNPFSGTQVTELHLTRITG